MICPNNFLSELQKNDINFFCGVPDSLLKELVKAIGDINNNNQKKHIIAANEGNAIAMASGYHLATNKIGLVYLQNSGIGNIINPITSLTDPEVYKIPMLLIVGWRGEPGIKDEPQHIKQGRITLNLFEILEIPYEILDSETNYTTLINKVISKIKEINSPVAIIVKKNTFSNYDGNYNKNEISERTRNILRETALKTILEVSNFSDIFISTTGKTSRELYELRESRKEKQKDFLTVGSMGHTSSIALGVALGQPNKRIICLDGDGSLLMHLGAMPIIADLKPKNFIHILLNNASHESVGGQPTVADNIDFNNLSKALGYTHYFKANCENSIKMVFEKIKKIDGPIFFEIIIKSGSRDNLSRPKTTPEENKYNFMENINEK